MKSVGIRVTGVVLLLVAAAAALLVGLPLASQPDEQDAEQGTSRPDQQDAEQGITYRRGQETIDGGAGALAVLGDSITRLSSDTLHAALEDPWYVYVDGRDNDLYQDRQNEAELIAATDPDVVVVHLGTNDHVCMVANLQPDVTDCHYPDHDADAVLDDARVMSEAFDPETCLLFTEIWLSLDPVAGVLPGVVDAGYVDGYVPWGSYLRGLPEQERALLVADDWGHLTDAGSERLAEVTRETVDESCGDTTGPTSGS